MTIASVDLSNYDGAPIMLYDFYRQSVPTISRVLVETHWRYTSADRDFVLGSDTYKATAITDAGISQSGSAAADQLTVTMPYNETVPQMFVGSPPSDPIHLVIRHANEGETDTFLVWSGLVGVVSRAATDGDNASMTASVVCNAIGATLDRTGLRLSWGRLCPHDLYGFECRADPTSFYVTATITALDGATVTAVEWETPPITGGTFLGGFLEWLDDDGHADRLGIIDYGGPTIRVMGTTDKLTVGQTVYAFLGCDHTRPTCTNIFSNIANHGGHAYMPDTNPFSGDLIY